MHKQSKKKSDNVQLIDPKTLSWWVQALRHGSGWPQETLAELSGLTVRTIQRVEAGLSANVHTQRALAKGLGYDNLDAFFNPETAACISKIRDDLRNLAQGAYKKQNFPGRIFVDAIEAVSGQEIGLFAASVQSSSSSYDGDEAEEAKTAFCALVDYAREYGECDELYTETQKLSVYDDFSQLLNSINKHGYGFYYGTRRIMLSGKEWKDKTPLKWNLGYMKLLKSGLKPVKLAVPKEIEW